MKIYHCAIIYDDGVICEYVREVRVEADNAAQAERIVTHCYLWSNESIGHTTHAYGE